QNAHASSSAIQSARDALTAAQTTAQTLQVQQQALALKYQDQVANPDIGGLLNQVTQASVIRNDLRSRVARYGLVGVAIGLALGVAAAVLLDRRAHQRHTADLEQAPADQEPDEDARELSPGTAGTRGDTPVRGAAAEKNGNRAVAELDEADRAPLATWVAPDDELLEADLDDHESRARVGADDVEHSDDTEPTDDTEPRKDERPKDDGRKDEPRKATAKSTGNGTDPKRDGHPAGARSPAGRNVVVKSAPVGTHAQDEWQ
ncbi:MAG TPA: hypothetical protein VHC41_05650, partial [Mycobacteriales bacterium]|nr:hypothetical protein [Mycobacteriales bacterium]